MQVINSDILNVNLKNIIGSYKNGEIKVIGNIPYYITSPILERLLAHKTKMRAIFITVQKEFAQRIAAPPGGKDYGAFSCFIQYHANPKVLFHIKNNSFFPKPKVGSSFLRLEIRSAPCVKIKDEAAFFELIRAAFNKRRKTLRNSLKDILPEEKLNAFFIKYEIDADIRPERLSLENFADLINIKNI